MPDHTIYMKRLMPIESTIKEGEFISEVEVSSVSQREKIYITNFMSLFFPRYIISKSSY